MYSVSSSSRHHRTSCLSNLIEKVKKHSIRNWFYSRFVLEVQSLPRCAVTDGSVLKCWVCFGKTNVALSLLYVIKHLLQSWLVIGRRTLISLYVDDVLLIIHMVLVVIILIIRIWKEQVVVLYFALQWKVFSMSMLKKVITTHADCMLHQGWFTTGLSY